jgi:hypothetical protein
MNELADAGSDLELWECEGRVILPLYLLIFVSYILYIYIYILYLVVFVFLFLCLCVSVFAFCGFAQSRLLFRVMKGREGRVICGSLLSVFVFFLWLCCCLCLCGLRSFVFFIVLYFSFILVFLLFFWFLGQASGLVFSLVQWVWPRPGNSYEPTCAVDITIHDFYTLSFPKVGENSSATVRGPTIVGWLCYEPWSF